MLEVEPARQRGHRKWPKRQRSRRRRRRFRSIRQVASLSTCRHRTASAGADRFVARYIVSLLHVRLFTYLLTSPVVARRDRSVLSVAAAVDETERRREINPLGVDLSPSPSGGRRE